MPSLPFRAVVAALAVAASLQPCLASPDSVVLIITRSTPEDVAQSDRLTQLLQETRAQVQKLLMLV